MSLDDDDKNLYRWEGGYEKTWEVIREDEDGLLDLNLEESLRRARRRKTRDAGDAIRLGVMRHVYVVLDMSEAMQDQDLKPTRHLACLKLLEKFVDDFLDQNPIGQLAFIITKNKRAELISGLGGNSKVHISALKAAADYGCEGEPSMYNALDLAASTLKNMPSHTSREIVIILGSLTTCDPQDIHSYIQTLKTQQIQCSVIGLSAELRICRLLAKETKGTYGVILDESHLKDLLYEQLQPPPAASNTSASLIRMGFPYKNVEKYREGKPSMCMCHLDAKTSMVGFGVNGYYCPQCQSKYCELPAECKACGLTLVSAPHLARSYHHFFPLSDLEEVQASTLNSSDTRFCYACCAAITDKMVCHCRKCGSVYCFNCDVYMHQTLHTCPGCANLPVLKH